MTAALFLLVHEPGGEDAIRSLVARLPQGPAYVVMPLPERDAEAGLIERLDDLAAPQALIGAHGHAVPAVARIVLADPGRFVGAAFLNGAFEPVDGAPLVGLPVFLAQGERDTDPAPALQDTTWRWLVSESGAPVTAFPDRDHHGPTEVTAAALAEWIEDRLARLADEAAERPKPAAANRWPGIDELPIRAGARPLVTWAFPQQQHSDQPSDEHVARLLAEVATLPGVRVVDSATAVPGTRALVDSAAGVEFAELHPAYDGSLHVVLPGDLAADVVAKGWAQPHMWAGTRLADGTVLVYGPRDDEEIAVVTAIVEAARDHAAE